jgi:hypothetical protein
VIRAVVGGESDHQRVQAESAKASVGYQVLEFCQRSVAGHGVGACDRVRDEAIRVALSHRRDDLA